MKAIISNDKQKRFSKSITSQVALPMILIGLLALTSMMATIIVTVYSENDAEAINVAGSMRMQSYRMAVMMGVQPAEQESETAFAAKLTGEHQQMLSKLFKSSITQVVARADNLLMNNAYAQVVENWRSNIEPLLLNAVQKPQQRAHFARQYLQLVDRFVEDINELVLQIQLNSEQKNELMGIFEGVSVFLFFMVISYIIMRVDNNLVQPLKRLVKAASHISRGDFSQRVDYDARDEIGLLSNVFNEMSASLAMYYRHLQEMVDKKTADLTRSNQVLDCLYKTAKRLSSLPVKRQTLENITDDLKGTLGLEYVSICLATEPNSDNYDLITPAGKSDPCLINDCRNCQRRNRRGQLAGGLMEYAFDIGEGNNRYGFLYLKTNALDGLEGWQQRLVEAVVDNIAATVILQSKESQSRRLILLEERSIIARELHDSLAQSLSYMKMQVTRLSKMYERDEPEEKFKQSLADLQEGLTSAYKHLRELLETFRLQLNAPTLRNALLSTVREFSKRHDQVSLEYDLGHCPLTPNEDIHILHIVREALSNAIKHAQAEQIKICCSREGGEILFQVEDNGIGLPDTIAKHGSFGHVTMRERAELLNGRIELASEPGKGTVVTLAFTPKHSLQNNVSAVTP